MMIFGCPVGKQHIERIIFDQFLRIKHKFSRASKVKIHFIYFSCSNDMSMLKMSLNSLKRLTHINVGSVSIVVDSKGVFTDEQTADLRRICPNLKLLHLGKIDWASADTLRTELKAFAIVAPLDFIAKIDSDILFFSEDKLNEVSVSSVDFIGDGHYSNYKYAQGGLYLLRKELALDLSTATESEISRTVDKIGTVAEDQVISELCYQRTSKIWLTRLMLFPNEYNKVNLANWWVRKEFSTIHFVHKKADMPQYASRLGIQK